MKHKVETPPKLQGSAEQQLRQMHSYLFRMAEGLNVVLGNLSETKPRESDSGNSYNELRTMIGNTAESVKELRKEIGNTAESVKELQKEIDKENGETATIDPLQLMPVGYIYISSNPTSPAELFGGTWEALTDRVIVGAGGKYDVNSTGGAETHTLTVNEMPSHNHTTYGSYPRINDDTVSGTKYGSSSSSQNWWFKGTINYTEWNGGSAAHNNMQPYIAKYMWERTA